MKRHRELDDDFSDLESLDTVAESDDDWDGEWDEGELDGLIEVDDDDDDFDKLDDDDLGDDF